MPLPYLWYRFVHGFADLLFGLYAGFIAWVHCSLCATMSTLDDYSPLSALSFRVEPCYTSVPAPRGRLDQSPGSSLGSDISET